MITTVLLYTVLGYFGIFAFGGLIALINAVFDNGLTKFLYGLFTLITIIAGKLAILIIIICIITWIVKLII